MKLGRTTQIVATSLLVGAVTLGIAPAATAAPLVTDVKHSTAAEVNRAGLGSLVEVFNDSYRSLETNSGTIASRKSKTFLGATSTADPDVAFKVGKTADRTIDISADNPFSLEASIRLATKTFDERGEVDVDGLVYRAYYRGERKVDDVTYKSWGVDVFESKTQGEYVHHTSQNDGVKGYIVNGTNKPILLKLNDWASVHCTLEPGKRLAFFDSHPLPDFRGMRVEVGAPGQADQRLSTVWLGDPYVGYPRADVQVEGREIDRQKYSEGESRRYQSGDNKWNLTVDRKNDGVMTSSSETNNTKDWAWFELKIDRA